MTINLFAAASLASVPITLYANICKWHLRCQSQVLCERRIVPFLFFLNRIVEADQQYDFFKFGGVLGSVFPREPHVHLTRVIRLVWRPSSLWAFFLWIVCRVTRGSFEINSKGALSVFMSFFIFCLKHWLFKPNSDKTKTHVNKYSYLFT